MKKRVLIVACALLIILTACQPAAPAVIPQNTVAAAPTEPPALPAAPTETVAPQPTAAKVKAVNVVAICTLIGKDPLTVVKAGTPVNITWGWTAKTEQQINDFLENNITSVTLDGKIIKGTKVEGILKNQTSGDPEVVWYSQVGVLSPGRHKLTYDSTLKKMISDGITTYGPGSKNEASHDDCEILVEAGPVSGAASTPGTAETPETGSTRVRPMDGMVMVNVPAGPFRMGSEIYNVEKPIHSVTLDGFWIDRTEVTNAMFEKFATARSYQTDAEKAGKSRVRNTTKFVFEEKSGADWRHPQGPQMNLDGLSDHPVVQVSWNDASAYCSWAGGRLPSEVEWEKAARGTDARTYPWGEAAPDATRLNFADVYLGKNAKDGYLFTVQVGSSPAGASPYGAYDMAGNVWEWTSDWFEPYPGNTIADELYGAKFRVLRGGCWLSLPDDVRTAYRYIAVPTLSSSSVGFRCALSQSGSISTATPAP